MFSWDGERVTVGEVEFSEGPVLIPYRIELDDESSVCVCPDTLVLNRKGAPRYPNQLTPDTSLLPLYQRINKDGYSFYQEPGEWHKKALTPGDRNRWRRVSRMVAEWQLERRCEPGDIVTFRSKDRTNCHPSNLKLIKRERKTTTKKANFAEPLFEAQRFIDRYNHKVIRAFLDTSCNMLSIRGLGTSNLSLGGIFISADSE